MEMTETMQLTKEQNLIELLELLRKKNMKEAAKQYLRNGGVCRCDGEKDGFCPGGTCDSQRPAS